MLTTTTTLTTLHVLDRLVDLPDALRQLVCYLDSVNSFADRLDVLDYVLNSTDTPDQMQLTHLIKCWICGSSGCSGSCVGFHALTRFTAGMFRPSGLGVGTSGCTGPSVGPCKPVNGPSDGPCDGSPGRSDVVECLMSAGVDGVTSSSSLALCSDEWLALRARGGARRWTSFTSCFNHRTSR